MDCALFRLRSGRGDRWLSFRVDDRDAHPRAYCGVSANVLRVYSGLLQMMLECYFARDLYFQVGCKANLLRLLYALAKHFWVSESLRAVMVRQQAAA